MKRQTVVAVLVVMSGLVQSCTAQSDGTATAGGTAAGMLAEPKTTEIRSAIDAANERWRTAMLAGDAAGALANYADTAVIMMPMMPMMRGRAAFEAGFKGMMGSMKINEVQSATMDLITSGDLAIESGTFSMTTTPTGGAPSTERGKYMTVWHHEADGKWKIIRDINNPDGAPEPAKKK